MKNLKREPTFLTYYLAQGLLKFVRFEQECLSEIKALEMENKMLKSKEKQNLKRSCQSLCTKVRNLKIEKN